MQLKGKNICGKLRRNWFHIFLLALFAIPIFMLMTLDYLDMESFTAFNHDFRFISTWKGRTFYLFFLWLIVIESIIDWKFIVEKRPRSLSKILAFSICAIIPTLYVLSVNFGGVNELVLETGQSLGFTRWALTFHWALSIEYLVFAFSFLAAIIFSYQREGLEFFSISLSLLVGMSLIYAIDTFYPQGIFKPFELLALPTAACAAAILDILGYNFSLHYTPGPNAMPTIMLHGDFPRVAIAWPCAGVHSLFLYTVITLLLFKRSNIQVLRKLVYFIVGAAGTYATNVLRIVSYFMVLKNSGEIEARFFHNNIGELYFISWIFTYLLIIVTIERFRLIERVRWGIVKIQNLLIRKASRFLSIDKKRESIPWRSANFGISATRELNQRERGYL